MDTFTSLWNRLLLRSSALEPALSQDLIRDAFNQLAERREWIWLMRSSSFYPSVFDQTGTVSVTPNSYIVTGVGTAFAGNYTNCQFRVGAPPSSYPTYTITQVLSPTSLLLDKPWIGPALSGAAFQIFQCYFAVPADFQYFYSLVNTTANYRLWTNLMQGELDLADPQRVQTGITYAASFYDYTSNFNGVIAAPLQVVGSGAVPGSSTITGYSYPANSLYTVEITTGGVVGVAVYKWKQDSGSYTTGITTTNDGFDLSNGVQVYFPDGTYVQGDVFVIQCTAQATSGVPRYELWPRPINTPYVYPFTYAAKLPDLSDANPTLPPFVARRGDVLLEMALVKVAQWPGTDTKPNPYFGLGLAEQHRQKSESLIYELEKKDDDTAIKDLTYKNIPFYPAPWMDGSWLQSHAIYGNP